MIKRITIFSILLFCSVVFVCLNQKSSNPAFENIRPWIISELENSKKELVFSSNNISQPELLKSSYLKARKHYKQVEFFVEYISPQDAKYMINGPLVSKHDAELSTISIAPMGFQKIEELLYDDFDIKDTTELKVQYEQLVYKFDALINNYKSLTIEDGLLLDMCQYEVFRLVTLNLNGFDATFVKNNIEEAEWSIEGVEHAISSFKTYSKGNKQAKHVYVELQKLLKIVRSEVLKERDYDSFDRLAFIKDQAIPLNQLLVEFHNTTGLKWSETKRALNLKESFLYGQNAFNISYFSKTRRENPLFNEQAELGEKLFYDPILSGNNLITCATCHNPKLGFTDNLAKSVAIDQHSLTRNTPTLLNVVYQKSFFWDGRVDELEKQVFSVVHNQLEMGGNLEDVSEKLRADDIYGNMFKKAFKGSSDTIISAYAIQRALTAYEKTLTSFNSKFDKYLRGRGVLNGREINGFNLFNGKANCGSCHFFPLFNGTVPPFYNDSEFEVLGVPATAEMNSMDTDMGRYKVTHQQMHLFSFKTPTVRNASITGPYMHNGVFNSLEGVMDFYNRGGGKGIGYFDGEQTLPSDSLFLSKEEKEDIILFLQSLTDTSGI